MPRRARLDRLTVAQLERLLDRKRRQAKVAPLERERDRLTMRIKKIEAKIARLKGASAMPSRRRKKKLSAAAKRRISRAQKRRWAKVRAAKKALRPKRRVAPRPAAQPQTVTAAS